MSADLGVVDARADSVGRRQLITSPVGAEIVIGGRRLINFAGSSYLGMSNVPEVIEAGVRALRKGGSGYQSARIYGFEPSGHRAAEQAAARFFQAPAALFLPSGYVFGSVAISSVRDRFDVVFYDAWAHSSLRDGIAVSGLAGQSFDHLDADDLRRKLREKLGRGARPLIVTDGLFSTLGQIAPLRQLQDAAVEFDGKLLVDDSHGFGVLGASGGGAMEHCGLSLGEALVGGSTSKGLGVVGGLLLGSEADIAAAATVPASRGASIGMAASAAMCAASLEYLAGHSDRLRKLREHAELLKKGLRSIGVHVDDGPAPSAAFAVGSYDDMASLQMRLMEQGFYVLHSAYIGAGQSGVIRCCAFADHSPGQIDQLIEALGRLL